MGIPQQTGEQECSQKDGHYHRDQCSVLLSRMEQAWVVGTELGRDCSKLHTSHC